MQGKSDEALKAITMSFSKNEAAAPAPLALGARPDRKVEAKAEAKSAQLEALVADDEVSEEPVVRKEEKKSSAVPAKKSNLLAMVDDWE
jgi:5-enolpyruvylshikimate-3-phosphate synthase